MEKPAVTEQQYFRSKREMIRTILWAAAGKALILSVFVSLPAAGLMRGIFGPGVPVLEMAVTVTGWSVLTAVVVQTILLMRKLG